MPPSSKTHIFGIRHHGPGSARSLRAALEELQPDVILVEGPPDAEGVLPLLAHAQMTPPVALLVYVPEEPRRAVYYPFAVFSPEWQAIHYGLTNSVPVRFMDLPQAHQLAMEAASETELVTPEEAAIPGPEPSGEAEPIPPGEPTAEPDDPMAELQPDTSTADAEGPRIWQDPLSWLAEAAGYSDGERWWEGMVERRQNSGDVFAAILEAMTAVRSAWEAEDEPRPDALREAQREAYMRQTIRTAEKQGFQKIAVVCGAWHGPALENRGPAKPDADLLQKLPKIKVQATWTPWTYGRLGFNSGYGAGVESPGWYHHLWTASDQVTIRWLTQVARLLREEDLDASSAHVIEAVRLADHLAALRDRPLPGLTELNEATRAIFCFGGDAPMRLIHRKLIVGETLGSVPDETPMVPLQQDLVREARRLRLAQEATIRDLDLDLRKPNELARSCLLHRLNLLNIPWGATQQAAGATGTFHELWKIQWKPEFAVAIIEASVWGPTVAEAAASFTTDAAAKSPELPTLTRLLDRALLADLPTAVQGIMVRLDAAAALTSDTGLLMDALPPLANVRRYGNVRSTDTSLVGHVIDGLVIRICVGLPAACASLNDDAAEVMFNRLVNVNAAIGLLQNDEYRSEWNETLEGLSDRPALHGLLAGRCCRLLLDARRFTAAETARRMGLALSTAAEPTQAAAWVEGLLKGSGSIILHDDELWQVLDTWVAGLRSEAFTAVAPLLRRTFSLFSAPERRQMGERARRAGGRPAHAPTPAGFNVEKAEATLPIIARLLGLGTRN